MQTATQTVCGLCLAAVLAAGCQNQQGAAPNPFLSADKVPPPSTRTPAPAVAQLYYQGQAPATTPTGAGLGVPSAAQLAAAQPEPSPPAAFTPSEGAIGLPTDNQPLRTTFASPQPQGAPTATLASAAAPIQSPAQPPYQRLSPPRPEPPVVSPDFSPLRPANRLAWGAGSSPAAQPLAQPASPAVYPSPAAPTQVAQASYLDAGTPRVRLPGYATPTSYAAPAAMAPRTGTVQITELPPAAHQPPPQPAAPSYGGDGFQPRGVTPSVY